MYLYIFSKYVFFNFTQFKYKEKFTNIMWAFHFVRNGDDRSTSLPQCAPIEYPTLELC